MKIGIVGHGADKFDPNTEAQAKELIANIMYTHPQATFVSGHSPMGGVDIWVEEIGKQMGVALDIKAPKQHSWDGNYGFKATNIDIAKSDVVYVIVVRKYPEDYKGRLFSECYHCTKHGQANDHVKSGGCWTGWKAIEMGGKAHWMILPDVLPTPQAPPSTEVRPAEPSERGSVTYQEEGGA